MRWWYTWVYFDLPALEVSEDLPIAGLLLEVLEVSRSIASPCCGSQFAGTQHCLCCLLMEAVFPKKWWEGGYTETKGNGKAWA